MVARETEDFVIGSVLLVGGVVITAGSVLLGAHWWFVLPAGLIAAGIKGYGWSRPVDERELAATPETAEHAEVGGREVLLRLLPIIVVWFGLDLALLLMHPDIGGAAGGVNIGIGLAFVATARGLVRYGRRHSIVIVSDAPRLYGFSRRADNLMRATRPT